MKPTEQDINRKLKRATWIGRLGYHIGAIEMRYATRYMTHVQYRLRWYHPMSPLLLLLTVALFIGMSAATFFQDLKTAVINCYKWQ